MKSKLALFIATLFLLVSCQGQTSPSVKNLAVETYAKTLESTSNPQLIDVRTPQEFAEEVDKTTFDAVYGSIENEEDEELDEHFASDFLGQFV